MKIFLVLKNVNDKHLCLAFYDPNRKVQCVSFLNNLEDLVHSIYIIIYLIRLWVLYWGTGKHNGLSILFIVDLNYRLCPVTSVTVASPHL